MIMAYKGEGIAYVRGDITEFEMPTYDGEWYEATVPDTLDLQERAALGISGLTGPTDGQAEKFQSQRSDADLLFATSPSILVAEEALVPAFDNTSAPRYNRLQSL